MYPSCPAISNLWVIAWRSAGSLRRTGWLTIYVSTLSSAFSRDVLSG